MKDFDKKIRAYALKNAIAYNGKANASAVLSSLFNEGLDRKNVKEVLPKIQEIIKEISKLSLEKQKKEFEKFEEIISHRKERVGLPELPNAEKGVVMRFRPGPSGALHVGHIVSTILSSMYVKKYGGKFYVIVDDTDPKTTMKESYGWIKRDCDWIFGNVTEYLNSSDRMKIYYEYVEKLIKKNFAYVCTCSGDEFRELAKEKKECPCRNLSVKENLERWKKMLATPKGVPRNIFQKKMFTGGKSGFEDSKSKDFGQLKNSLEFFNEGEAVLRFKSDMKHPNPAMRDFPLARITLTPHPIQKDKYRVWPLMNLVVAVDDIELGMTHIIRGKDHMDNAEKQKMIFDIFGKKFPWTFFIGKIKFTDINLSKRKIKAAIERGEYENFEDEKLPTLISLKKRGYKPEAFEKFAEQRGLTEVDKIISQKDFFDVIDKFNKI